MTKKKLTENRPPLSLERATRSLDADLFGRMVRILRLRLNLSQEGLAEKAKVSRATVVAIEGGTADPRLSTICSLANALGVRPGELVP